LTRANTSDGAIRGRPTQTTTRNYISADDFLYARCGVVAAGRTFYETVQAQPSLFPTDVYFGCLLSVAGDAYEEVTGEPLTTDFPISYESFSNSAGWLFGPDTVS
jgi:Protein of unknown function (DUF4240)